MVRNLLIAIVMVFSLATFAACEKGASDKDIVNPDQSAGADGGACLEDGTCNSGLTCTNDVCSGAPADGAEEGAGENSAADAGSGTCPDGMVFIKGGTFQMGSTSSLPEEKPVHSVTLSAFCMDEHEFTNGDKDAAVFAGFTWPAVYSGSNKDIFNEKTRPLISVNWAEAKAICEKQGKSLPTEAQWEYAARGGKQYEYGTADGTLTDTNACWKKSQSCPVKSYAANPFGLYDMSGNVWEWMADWYAPYSTSAVTDPTGPATGSNRVLRGGCWDYIYPTDFRAALRGGFLPGGRSYSFGFRCASAPRTP